MSKRLARSWLLALMGCAATACAQPREDVAHAVPAGCTLRVIVALDALPDGALLADLSRVSGVRLELVRTMTSNLHLISLEAAGTADACTAAMERLRADPRVRSVDVDQRREIQTP